MSPDRDVPPDDRSGRPDPDVDAAFAQIVAGWDDDEPAPPVPPWPATEDLVERAAPASERGPADTGGPTGTARTGEARTGEARTGEARTGEARAGEARPEDPAADGSPRRPRERGKDPGGRPEAPTGPPAPGPRDWEVSEEPDEGYVPPEPPPLPRGDVVSRLAWAGVLLGPTFLLLSALVWDGAGPVPLALAALAFIGGFVTLVARLPARRDDEDDDGAVV